MYHSIFPWNRNVFLDCGGNNGSSVRKFLSEFDRGRRFTIFSFEPNKIYEPDFALFAKHKLIQAAVSDRDGVAEFYLDREDGDGSTLFKNKLTQVNGGFGTLDTVNPDIVATVDLSRWIREELRGTDYIVLKLDVEGAEYDILERMEKEGSLNRIRHLFVEWHWQKVGIPESRHIAVQSLLAKKRIPVLEWDAIGF